MKNLLIVFAAALCALSASAQPKVPPGVKGNPPPQLTKSLPKPPGADKPVPSVQGGVHAQKKQGRAAPTEELKFNPPKR